MRSLPAGGCCPLAGLVLAPAWALLAWRIGLDPVLPALLYLAAVGVLLAYVDLRVRLLPNAVVLPSYVVVGCPPHPRRRGLRQWANLGLGAPGRSRVLWGFWRSWDWSRRPGWASGTSSSVGSWASGSGGSACRQVLIGVAYAFVLGGLVSLALISGGRATRRSAIPFGPFLLVGFLLAVLAGDELVGLVPRPVRRAAGPALAPDVAPA